MVESKEDILNRKEKSVDSNLPNKMLCFVHKELSYVEIDDLYAMMQDKYLLLM